MPRFVFFSFAYDDVINFKVNVVRNSWLLKNKDETFIDGSIWEKSKTKGPVFLKKLIDLGLYNTSVTVVLIGQSTANRWWINYEIVKSFEKGNGIVGIHINRIKGLTGLTSRGQNPLDRLAFQISEDGRKINFFELINGKWFTYKDLPQINNKKSNSLYFTDQWWQGNDFGKSYRFSEKFGTMCWVFDEGHKNFVEWIEEAALITKS